MGDYDMDTNVNLISCTSCGQQISKSAEICPSCGAKVKQPIYRKKFFWFLIIALSLVCIILINNAISNSENAVASSNSGNGVVVNGESFSISEFANMVENNNYKFSNTYVGEVATVTGNITKIQSNYRSTNLNHTFSAVIVVEGKWYFEVSSSNSILNSVNVGDKVTAKAKISTDLYGDVYCYGNAIINKK